MPSPPSAPAEYVDADRESLGVEAERNGHGRGRGAESGGEPSVVGLEPPCDPAGDLLELLDGGEVVAGAQALDVYEEESAIFFEDRSDQVVADDVFSRLLTFPNVLITGHQGCAVGEVRFG